ncbi:hypothetical protein J6590_063732 [Homalodisca vitripennis]|nr:hypothetical protein J6590_063732 [Homalodisca vitripennis]
MCMGYADEHVIHVSGKFYTTVTELTNAALNIIGTGVMRWALVSSPSRLSWMPLLGGVRWRILVFLLRGSSIEL